MDTFNLIAGIITIASFVFAVWVWMRYSIRLQEFSRIVRAIHDTVDTVIWEADRSSIETDAIRLRQADKMLGHLSSIRKFTAEQLGIDDSANIAGSLGLLLERGVVWTGAMLWRLESSLEMTEVWLVTPDLKPDSVDKELGALVNENLKKDKRYVYFYPDNLLHADVEIARLYSNIGARDGRFKFDERVKIIPLTSQHHSQLFPQHNNIVIFFRDQERSLLPRCFGEVCFTKVKERGAFWQEHDEATTRSLYHLLSEVLAASSK